jgi:EmrB/QacA subfamily drug resistance transporter
MSTTIAERLVERGATSKRLILALVLVAQFMIILDTTIVSVALPSIQGSLHFASQLSLQWVINAYVLVVGGFLLLGGRAGDLYGRRTLFVSGLTLFTAASLFSGLAQSTSMLIVGRAMQGFGGAMVTPAVLSIIVATFEDVVERGKALGIFAAVTGGASTAGFLIGGAITEALSWRWIFFINIPIGVVGVLLALRRIPNSRGGDGSRTIDVPGAVTVTGGASLLVYAVVSAQAWGWGSTRFILTVVGAALLLAVFVAVELRSREPLVRLGIFRSRTLSAANVVMLFFIGGQFTMLFFPTLYMQEVLGYSPVKTGLAYLPWSVAFVFSSPIGQRLIPRFGARPMLLIGLIMVAAGLFLLNRLPEHASYAADLLPSLILNSIGAGLCFATLFLMGTVGVSSDEAGLASGIINSSQQLGAAIGLAALAAVAANRTAHLLHVAGATRSYALTGGFHRGFLAAGAIDIVAAVIALVTLRRTDLERSSEPATGDASRQIAQPQVLLAFDGSDNAREAIRVAARKLGPGPAAVVTVWQPHTSGSSVCISCPPGVTIPVPTARSGEAVEVEAKRAQATAEEGAQLARAAGFDAQARALRTDGAIGAALVDYTDQHPTSFVVLGTRGISGVHEALVGSVTHYVTEHAHTPVLSIPPKDGDVSDAA